MSLQDVLETHIRSKTGDIERIIRNRVEPLLVIGSCDVVALALTDREVLQAAEEVVDLAIKDLAKEVKGHLEQHLIIARYKQEG